MNRKPRRRRSGPLLWRRNLWRKAAGGARSEAVMVNLSRTRLTTALCQWSMPQAITKRAITIDNRPQQCVFYDLMGKRIGELWLSGHDYDLPLRTYIWHGRLFREGPPRGLNEFTEVAIPETIQ